MLTILWVGESPTQPKVSPKGTIYLWTPDSEAQPRSPKPALAVSVAQLASRPQARMPRRSYLESPGNHFPQLVSAAGSWEAVLVCLLAVLSPGTGAPAGQGCAILPVESPLRDSFPSSPDIGSLLSKGLNVEN